MELKQPSEPACPFCRIVRGEASADVLHRDEMVLAFRDRHPVAPTHILIIPIRHLTSLQELGDSQAGLLDHIVAVARQLADQEGVSAAGYRLVINTGADAGQSVFHMHMHMLAGRRLHWPPG
jgi:histidine triad (HIT) family protein